MISKTLSAATAALVLASAGAGVANAGCLGGAVVGGVGGHFAHHPILGAAAGCAVGHHMAVMKHRRERAMMAQQRGY